LYSTYHRVPNRVDNDPIRRGSLRFDGTKDWNKFYFLDEVPNRELNDGREMGGLLIGTPYWAAGSSRGVPTGLYYRYSDPNNAWGQFVKETVQRYQGRIHHWIIWNEPDIWNNAQGTMAWEGGAEDYAQLLKVGCQAAKSVNPNAVVVQAWGMALSAGAQRIEYYKMQDEQYLPVGVRPYEPQRWLVAPGLLDLSRHCDLSGAVSAGELNQRGRCLLAPFGSRLMPLLIIP